LTPHISESSHEPTANALIKALINKNILVEITGQQRGRVYAFQRYLDLFTS